MAVVNNIHSIKYNKYHRKAVTAKPYEPLFIVVSKFESCLQDEFDVNKIDFVIDVNAIRSMKQGDLTTKITFYCPEYIHALYYNRPWEASIKNTIIEVYVINSISDIMNKIQEARKNAKTF